MFESEKQEAKCRISTAINIEQIKTSDDQSISRGTDKAPEMCNFKVEGTEGEMYMRYTAAAGIDGTNILEDESNKESRGKMITNGNFYDDYGLFAYEYPSTQIWSSVSATATPTIVNEQVLASTGWMTNEFWPGAGSRLAFYGYAPYNATGVTNLPTPSTVGKPKFRYTTPTETIKQNDLLVSEDDAYIVSTNENGGVDVPGNYNVIKTLKFKHACTAVRLAVGDRMAACTITKIAIKGVYGEADYNYGAGSGLNQGAWENYNSTLYDYELNADFTVLATDQNKIINNGKYTFMLIPQIVPDGATIEITLNDGQEHTIKANISGSNWKMGYSVTYFLTTSTVDDNYVLSVSADDTSLLSTGSSNSMTIKSYKQSFYGSQIAVPWILTYNYEDDILGASQWSDSANDILTSITKFTGNGGTVGESNTFQVAKQVERSKPWRNTHTATLRAATEQGSAGSPVDLSAGKQTANCYVVSAPGHYRFPLVYGNARNADGTDNTNAYGSAIFVDHNGVQIDNPYIYQTNGGANVPANALIVWQDAPHLITPNSVKLSDDMHYIEFQVEQKNICQGNSVLAVCDASGTIMWSWHIWVTDYDMGNTIEVRNDPSVAGSVISHFMEVPLGFCDAEVRVRDERKFKFKVKQADSAGRTATITFEQLSADSLYTYGYNAPYYQWGRKDPMLPSVGTGNIDKPYYDNQYIWGKSLSTSEIKETIKYPYLHNQSIGNSSVELWCKGNTQTGIVNREILKTIYDPSISSFYLPNSASLTGCTSATTIGFTNTPGKTGWTFYAIYPNSGSIFFQMLGCRSPSGDAIDWNGDRYPWGNWLYAIPKSASQSGNFTTGSSTINTLHDSSRNYAFNVRSVKE